ncbi:MAG: efflux RND transporter periplasmic adaptor subunit, partial [Spongiibacteraceae bacterium]|nr:efflux RND transporter periplasmic adaptor subunit [Spongiibacteraceae bacterium]
MSVLSHPFVRRSLRILPVTAVILLAGCVADPAPQAVTETPPPEIGVYTVESRPLALNTELPGRTAPFRVAEVRPQVSGIIQERQFIEGAEVKQGQPLYRIDPAPYRAALARAEANLASARSLAKRYERLIETQAISRQQYDDAMAAWKAAEAALEVARIDMQYTQVLSPISGRIGRTRVTEGALVTAGQPQEMAVVTQLDPIYVDVTQPVTQMLRLQRAVEAGRIASVDGQEVKVGLTLEDGSQYPLAGTLKFSEVIVDAGTGSVTLRAE